MTKDQFLSLLKKHYACSESIEWIKSTDHTTAQEIWDNCPRGDWVLWLAARNPAIDRKLIVRCAIDCARPAMQFAKDPRPAACLDALEKWLIGEATMDEVRAARSAYAADYAAAASASSYAYAAAAYAAAAAASDAYAAAAYAAASAASDAAAYARTKTRADQAVAIRKTLTLAMVLGAEADGKEGEK